MTVPRLRAHALSVLAAMCAAACATPPVDRAQGAHGASWRAQLARQTSTHAAPSWRWPSEDRAHGSSTRAGAASFDRRSAGPGGAVVAGDASRQKIGRPYQINGVWYVPARQDNYHKTGVASWYGAKFHGRSTANGEVFDMNAISAAHTTLPLPSIVRVTNLENGRSLTVRVNDRGPFVDGRIIDLSRAAARALGFEQAGTARVRVRYLGPAAVDDAPQRLARAARRRPVAARPVATALADGGPAPLETVRRKSDALQRVVMRPWREFLAAEAARRDAAHTGFAEAASGRR